MTPEYKKKISTIIGTYILCMIIAGSFAHFGGWFFVFLFTAFALITLVDYAVLMIAEKVANLLASHEILRRHRDARPTE